MMTTRSESLSDLVVDLDGTLTPADTLSESVIRMGKASPVRLLLLPFWLLKGKAFFKDRVARRTEFRADLLPYNDSIISYIREEKEKGRRIILATAAHRTIAEEVAAHLGLFDMVLSTDATTNLLGKEKLAAIRKVSGDRFLYAGDSRHDLPVWLSSEGAITSGVSPSLTARIRQSVPVVREFPGPASRAGDWFQALRFYQWLKNLLIFVPLLTGFSFLDTGNIMKASLAFLAFSLAASGNYIMNDLWDLEYDRSHPRKKNRPFASARLPLHRGAVLSAACLVSAFLLSLFVTPGFVVILALYLVITTAYSVALKGYVLLDVLILSGLYTLRIFAGSQAVGIVVSSWLMIFSVFIFLSLALVKRCSELLTMDPALKETVHGRDYRFSDLDVLWPLGIGSALSSVVVFGLFVDSPETQARYATPNLLWIVALCLVYWLSRIWIKTSRKEMHDDPIVFALKDRNSLVTILLMIAVMLTANFFHIGFLR